jgi:hypothetical protein
MQTHPVQQPSRTLPARFQWTSATGMPYSSPDRPGTAGA